MKKHVWKLIGVLGLTTVLISGGVFASSALADAYDDQYGDAADIARASQWALDGQWGPDEDQGGWAGSNYYDNEAWLDGTKVLFPQLPSPVPPAIPRTTTTATAGGAAGPRTGTARGPAERNTRSS